MCPIAQQDFHFPSGGEKRRPFGSGPFSASNCLLQGAFNALYFFSQNAHLCDLFPLFTPYTFLLLFDLIWIILHVPLGGGGMIHPPGWPSPTNSQHFCQYGQAEFMATAAPPHIFISHFKLCELLLLCPIYISLRKHNSSPK